MSTTILLIPTASTSTTRRRQSECTTRSFSRLVLWIITVFLIRTTVATTAAATVTADDPQGIDINNYSSTSKRRGERRLRLRSRTLKPGTECTLYLKLMEYESLEVGGQRRSDRSSRSSSIPDNSDTEEIGTEATTVQSSSRNPPEHHKESVWTCEVPVPIYVDEDDESRTDQKDDGEDRRQGVSRKKTTTTTPTATRIMMMMLDIVGVDDANFFENQGAISGTSTMLVMDQSLVLGGVGGVDTTESDPAHAHAQSKMESDGDCDDEDDANCWSRSSTRIFSSDNDDYDQDLLSITKLIIPPFATIKVINNYGYDTEQYELVPDQETNLLTRRRQLQKFWMEGDKRTLVVRAIGKDGKTAPEYDSDTMYGAVFGDELCLAQAYRSCSYDQLRIVPYVGITTTGKDISNGVVDIQMTIDPTTSKFDVIQTDVSAQLQLQLGDVIQFDLIIYCIPRNTEFNWIAFAFANGRESFYHGKWCNRLSALQHEVGHNIGFAHSGEMDSSSYSSSYADQSCIMGVSYNAEKRPAMCFNAAKMFQSPWYDNMKRVINPMDYGVNVQKCFLLYGVVDYQPTTEVDSGKYVSVLLEQDDSPYGYYLGYNRKRSFNGETQESPNSVTIIMKEWKNNGYAQSWKNATLKDVGSSYTISNWNATESSSSKSSSNISIKIELTEKNKNNNECRVCVTRVEGNTFIVGTKAPTASPTKPMTNQPTKAPTSTRKCTRRNSKKVIYVQNGKKKKCGWIKLGKSLKIRKNRCKKKYRGKKIKHRCPKNCGLYAGVGVCKFLWLD